MQQRAHAATAEGHQKLVSIQLENFSSPQHERSSRNLVSFLTMWKGARRDFRACGRQGPECEGCNNSPESSLVSACKIGRLASTLETKIVKAKVTELRSSTKFHPSTIQA